MRTRCLAKWPLTMLLLCLSFTTARSQVTIRGDVYGGGLNGSVGTQYIDRTTTDDSIIYTQAEADSIKEATGTIVASLAWDAVKLVNNTPANAVTKVIVHSDTVRTVFGGGKNGRTYGNTCVVVDGDGAQIGYEELKRTVYGGLYGGGEGASAYVYGNTNVTIEAGNIIQKVYGGGCQADLIGHTYVHLLGGNIRARGVFGGARMADIYGHSYVLVDGDSLKNDLVINAIYGGNDVSGTITKTIPNENWTWVADTLPARLQEAAANGVNKTWNAFVQTTNPDKEDGTGKQIFIGQLYGGGDGDYDYDYTEDSMTITAKLKWYEDSCYVERDSTYVVDGLPTLAKTYLEICGGTIGYVYGGGNKATVTDTTTICIDNASKVVTQVYTDGTKTDSLLTPARIAEMGLNTLTTYQFSRVFGGNNKVAMHIRPTWKLKRGQIDNLYSGGNAGDMTHPNGIVLAILPGSDNLTVNNVYGGCRKADVHPENEAGELVDSIARETDGDWTFPAGYAARVLIEGGNINNVYGGCDVSGSIYFGTDVRIMSSVWGNVYGGGNGAYAYTDQEAWENDSIYGDFYYGDKVVASEGSPMSLNKYYRPNVENTYIHITGSETKDTYIGGVFCGGNSATLRSLKGDFNDVRAKLHIGSYVVADSVFLGSNGENMKDSAILAKYADRNFSSINLTDTAQLNSYMRGVAVYIHPELSFDPGYVAWSTKIGSLYCGGNVGSMKADGLFTLPFERRMVIYDKVVGGCNNANIPAKTGIIANYEGGITGLPAADGRKLVLNFDSLRLEPKYVVMEDDKPTWNADGRIKFEWRKDTTGLLVGGNVYGGCYNSGHVNGDVEINLMSTTCYVDSIFATEDDATANSGIDIGVQGEEVLGTALNVFGGGYGEDSEIWGSTTVNLKKGYTFQVFGGGMAGVVGKGVRGSDGKLQYSYDGKYSTTVNLCGDLPGVEERADGDSDDMASSEYLYAGGFEGLVAGNTHMNLGNGRIYDAFGGSCNADVLGHTETYIGKDGLGHDGFPWIEDNVYGGNDLGGEIKGDSTFASAARNAAIKASAYVEYCRGRVDSIFGGCYGAYDYKNDYPDVTKPKMGRAYVNLAPTTAHASNAVYRVYGGSEGYLGYFSAEGMAEDKDTMQQSSYVLVNIPQEMTNFTSTEVFGSGANCGVDTTVVDLLRGHLSTIYGGSDSEGITGRTEVNVPSGSTIELRNIFGGAYGSRNDKPCDVIEAHVRYSSDDARVGGWRSGIYGGNNNCRRTLYSFVDIDSPVWFVKNDTAEWVATVFGAGYGEDTWAQYTEVHLNDGAKVYEVYGGGSWGMVLNTESVDAWKTFTYLDKGSTQTATVYKDLGKYNGRGGLADSLARVNGLGGKTNTNVYIHRGASVSGYIYENSLSGAYAYGGGYGSTATVSGTTYIGLHGGTVPKDVYAGGSGGAVQVKYAAKDAFTATTNAYIEGGSARNVYGGGYAGHVGYHAPGTTATTTDIPGKANVVIGIRKELAGADTTFYKGAPTIQRNAYGGGEDGGVYGTAHITLNNGYIGYYYEDDEYKEKIFDETWRGEHNETDTIGRLANYGCIFGGAYNDKSVVDSSYVTMYGGLVRGSLHGGGELAAIGRGETQESGESNSVRELKAVHKAGATHVAMYGGHVLRDVFGGGRGYNSLGYGSSNEVYTDGYVFGTTEVLIRGGEIGTADGVSQGYGNVFGGGDIGYVYSPVLVGKTIDEAKDADGYYTDGTHLTEDCRVVVEPWCRVDSTSITINGTTYAQNEFVPAMQMNYIGDKNTYKAKWDSLDLTGITIHNAVFAGGNVSAGHDVVYANTKTVFGNATATLFDLYHRDLITLGTEYTGGLYGDGNLTLVDGYRELNITNYGTDYYGMSDNITIDEYYKLNDRERAYFELKYKCKKGYTKDNVSYTKGFVISEDDYKQMDEDEQENWERAGFCSIYAGRLLNTIQRADFVGVFGSRMVLQGARDRVSSQADYINYTINRVGEVSLNQVKSVASELADSLGTHGNYFGIYNIVNHMGALTSDVNFDDERTTNNSSSEYAPKEEGETFYGWKADNYAARKRNNGTSLNKVALASGVYLELTTEKSTPSKKDYGYITGVIQLDLINVMPGEGGGYVYAKNEHGVPEKNNNEYMLLSSYNINNDRPAYGRAVTRKNYTYSTADLEKWQTSGNFVHNVKQIVDDCYPRGGMYEGANASEGHYWFIKGQVYLYEQNISAYTGAASAYQKSVHIPLTVTAASNGQMRLVDVKQNYYAYYLSSGVPLRLSTEAGATEADTTMLINNITYTLNQPISYWEYSQLSPQDRAHFVEQTYVSTTECTVGGSTYLKGSVLLPSDYKSLADSVYHTTLGQKVPKQEVFHPSNELAHNTGYALTFEVSNPGVWSNQVPTYSTSNAKVYGQRTYRESDIITGSIYAAYNAIDASARAALSNQAEVVRAYMATEEADYTTTDGQSAHANVGSSISKTTYDLLDAATKAKFGEAYVCTGTLDIGINEYVLNGELLTADSIETLKAKYMKNYSATQEATDEMFAHSVDSAYYCTQAGLYGGSYFDSSQKYGVVDGWCSLSADDRQHFNFNYDAFDLLIDSLYLDGENQLYGKPYYERTPIDYTARYEGTTALSYTDSAGVSHTINPSDTLSRVRYELLPNEKRYYAPLEISTGTGNYYIVRVAFMQGETPYAVGEVITENVYGGLSDAQKNYVEIVEFTDADIEANGNKSKFYYCRQGYLVGQHGEGQNVTDLHGGAYGNGEVVPVGTIITEENYEALTNRQLDFTIHGDAPVETSSLYVAQGSSINDLTKDKIITVIYEYSYDESDAEGHNIETIIERHVVNITIQFKSGVPSIPELHRPSTVLPGTIIGLGQPHPTPGAYEILGGGWEIYETEEDAELNRNGREYDKNNEKLYWYQDGNYVAYYAKTYLGKTYSNAVPVSVANYHDLKAVMADSLNHYFVDSPKVKRNSKIYINNYGSDAKDGLDLLSDFYQLSTEGLPGHSPLDSYVARCDSLDFILRTNINHTGKAWTPLGGDTGCFGGTLHGDGYTISGLSQSLFGDLCGEVYNLGVEGSFSTAGIADTGSGYVENCWVKTTGTPDGSVWAVLGNPTATGSFTQVENCYYMVDGTANYKTDANAHGNARQMTDRQFRNGTVAYNLNGHFLKQRYNDKKAATAEAAATYGYVEQRYGTPDFRYADGTIPTVYEPRLHVDELTGEVSYAPLWPDDYLFFGQRLTYGHTTAAHDSVPTHLAKGGSTNTLSVSDNSNRVYRAPAYFGSKKMGAVHFNSYAVLAAHTADGAHEAYPGMTAIDLYGHNDRTYTKAFSADSLYFQPLLDPYVALTGVVNADLTHNLLAYASDATRTVLQNYFTEPTVAELTAQPDYRAVGAIDDSGVRGHVVVGSQAPVDHVLADRHDFNAPIAYSFASGRRMWYQRRPDSYVTRTATGGTRGWDGISLPFSVELVTTPDKGEITHFYGTDDAKGHEYWLRCFTAASSATADGVVTATMSRPSAETGYTKEYANTFLWDYYYNSGNDQNDDEYSKRYYADSHTYADYPMQHAGEPYLLGLPGASYYEFDLSGQFVPQHAKTAVGKLSAQPVIFASQTGATIGVSDDELTDVTNGGYGFRPVYSARQLAAGTAYVLNAAGDSYVAIAADVTTVPFRPYFVAAAASGVRTRSIVFGDDASQLGGDDEPLRPSARGEALLVSSRRHKIIVESDLQTAADVRILTPAGLTLTTFTIAPGETVETRVALSGVYIVQTTDGTHTKKLAVK